MSSTMWKWGCFEATRNRKNADKQRTRTEVLGAVWALRCILTPAGFQDFKLHDGLPGSNKRFSPNPVSERPWSAFEGGISTAVSQINNMFQLVSCIQFQDMARYKNPTLDACVAVYQSNLNEDGQVNLKCKAKSFVRTYQ